MCTDQHRHSLISKFQHYFFQLFDRSRIKTYHRLIEKDHLRLYRKGTADAYFLHHSFRQFVPKLILLVIHLKFFQDLLHFLVCNIAVVRHPDIFNMFSDSQSVKHIRDFRHICKYFLCLDSACRKSLDPYHPFIPQQPCNTLDDRRLAGAVRSEQNADLAVRNCKIHIINRHIIPIRFAQSLYLKHKPSCLRKPCNICTVFLHKKSRITVLLI